MGAGCVPGGIPGGIFGGVPFVSLADPRTGLAIWSGYIRAFLPHPAAQRLRPPLRMDFPVWLTFFAAAWLISLSPGAGAVAAMSAGLNHGFLRGYVLSIGLVLGIWTQVLVVGLGLGALIAASTPAFTLVKWSGVAYLVWLGIRQWRAPPVPMARTSADLAPGTPRATRVTRQALILSGWMVNAVNPKGTVFLLAVVPQFLDLTRPLAGQYGVIALTLAFTDLVVMGGYTALASKLLRLLKSPRQISVLNRTFGGLFVAAGVLLALFKRG